ncbi:MAG: asparagine synthase-related protein [Candidatus Nealsonbacteria bacterium]|nr:asparagine synthase-related protein [Candidatus Nealsonbacteria bacterium]
MNNEKINFVNNWREVINMPIIDRENHRWSLRKLEAILFHSVKTCARQCLKDNNGEIHTTLSGGLDSSFCLALIRKITGPDCSIYTYTIGGSERNPDIIFARKVSKVFNSIHYELIPKIQEIRKARRVFRDLFKNNYKTDIYRSGDLGVFLICQFITGLNNYRPISLISHDGIDELLGGYWDHRGAKEKTDKIKAFEDYWSHLKGNHLRPLENTASHFGISVIFPYLQKRVVEYITRIPVEERTSHDRSKIPLRDIAKEYLPSEVIKRKKLGFNTATLI